MRKLSRSLSGWLTPYQLKKAILYPRTVYMRRRELKLRGTVWPALELHYFRKTFYRFVAATIENPQLLHTADINQDSVVLDVGAFTGEWAKSMMDRYDATVYAFEPNPRIFSVLKSKAPNYPKLQLQQYGLGDEDMVTPISLKGLGSSIFDHANSANDEESVEVEIKSVDNAWEALGLGDVDLLKINIEGAEFPLLERMIELDMLSRARIIMVQFHEWHPGAYGRRRRIRTALARTHDQDWDYPFVWEKWTRKRDR